MKVKGNYTLNAEKSTIWDLLMDSEILARITPGISELEEQGEDQYKAISNIRIGPVKASFEGELSLKDKKPNDGLVVAIDQKSKIGNVTAEIGITLKDNDEEGTDISYEGDAKLSGKLATMGQRIVGGVVSTMSKQFFKSLQKEIEN